MLFGLLSKITIFSGGKLMNRKFISMALAAACVARMLRDCMERRITVHWDAQNDVSRHLAEKFGFEAETEYSVYWLPKSSSDKTKQSLTGLFP